MKDIFQLKISLIFMSFMCFMVPLLLAAQKPAQPAPTFRSKVEIVQRVSVSSQSLRTEAGVSRVISAEAAIRQPS